MQVESYKMYKLNIGTIMNIHVTYSTRKRQSIPQLLVVIACIKIGKQEKSNEELKMSSKKIGIPIKKRKTIFWPHFSAIFPPISQLSHS